MRINMNLVTSVILAACRQSQANDVARQHVQLHEITGSYDVAEYDMQSMTPPKKALVNQVLTELCLNKNP